METNREVHLWSPGRSSSPENPSSMESKEEVGQGQAEGFSTLVIGAGCPASAGPQGEGSEQHLGCECEMNRTDLRIPQPRFQ